MYMSALVLTAGCKLRRTAERSGNGTHVDSGMQAAANRRNGQAAGHKPIGNFRRIGNPELTEYQHEAWRRRQAFFIGISNQL